MMYFTGIYIIIALYSIYMLVSFNKKYPKLLAAPEV